MGGWHRVHELTGWHGWTWQGWNPLVAFGTLVLAGFTFYLALKTRSLAREGRAEQLARSRPALVTAEDTITWTNANLEREVLTAAAYVHPETVILGVRNVGEGPAFNARFRSNRWMGETDINTLAVGDRFPMMLSLESGWTLSVAEGLKCKVVVEYEDIAHNTYYTAITLLIDAVTNPPQYAEVFSVVVYDQGETPPETDFDELASRESE